MASYATVEDVRQRIARELSEAETAACGTLLEDASVLIDAAALSAGLAAKKAVSCRMVIRALGDGKPTGMPIGAMQGSMSALGYTQSWTVGSGGSTGELYLSKQDKAMLGCGNRIGMGRSPLEPDAAHGADAAPGGWA